MFPATNRNPNFLLHQNPTSSSTPDEDPPFLYFPSPFLDDDPPLSQIFSHHQVNPKLLLQPDNGGEEPDSTIKKRISAGLKPRKRTGKKDRHSKIKTAQGVRDRRMRLSVQIARKFFDLQDMLGFDKASKTIEWLFSNSNNAIKELSTKHNNGGASSSAMEDSSKKEKLTDCDNLQARESREKARARARERTKEKTMKTKEFSSNPNNNNNSLEKMEELGFPSNPSPFLDEVEPNSYVTNNLDLVQEKSSPHDSIASIFECYHNLYAGISADTDSPNSFMGNFLDNWDLDTAPRILISPFSGNPDSNI